MKNNNQMKIPELLLRMIAPAIFVLIGTCIIFPFSKGMPLFDMPKANEVVKVEITDHTQGKTIVSEDMETIELAVGMKNFITYKVGSSHKNVGTGDIEIIYYLSDGTEQSFSADDTTLYRNNTAYYLKEEGMFIKLAKAVFFGWNM